MSKKMILLAGVALVGGVAGKPHTTPSGEVVDDAEMKRLGLAESDVPVLLANGFLIEAPERAARGDDDDVVDGITRDEFSAFLTRHGIAHDANADIDKLLAIAPVPAFDLDGAAKKIENSMGVDVIKAELTKLEVPFETDANKPALAKLLAQVRAAQPSAA